MRTKILELRDQATFIPVVATLMVPENPRQIGLLRRAGYGPYQPGSNCVLLTRAAGGDKAYYDAYDWADRTFKVAHEYIQQNWDGLSDGDVVDVEFILGETKEPKKSEVNYV